MDSTIIRKGTTGDIHELLRLIKELATYEKAPDEVIVTEEILLEDGFGPNKIFDFFVAEYQKKVIGIALYYTKYSTWKGKCIFLEDIIVTEEMRCKGIGLLLFNEVKKIAKKKNVPRLEWQVLEWNRPAINFYKKQNSYLDPEWVNCKLTQEQLQE